MHQGQVVGELVLVMALALHMLRNVTEALQGQERGCHVSRQVLLVQGGKVGCC